MTFLFQGDRMTECGRDRRRNFDLHHQMGSCYPFIIQATLNFKYPSLNLTFQNHALGGATALITLSHETLLLRNVRPDVVSILLGAEEVRAGVNEKDFNVKAAMEPLGSLLQRVKETNATIVLIESFSLQGLATSKVMAQVQRRQVELAA
ncbi:hypothetical protein B484DRAFT_411468, partial [Ochromonadaceae sp. CCMP2298]